MTRTPDLRPPHSGPEPRSRAGLRIRLWLGCLGAALVAAAGIAWTFATPSGVSLDPEALRFRVFVVLGASLIVGAALALWLDRGIVTRLRHLLQGVAAGQIEDERHVSPTAGWGELADLARSLQLQLSRQRHLTRAAEELELTQRQIRLAREAVERWVVNERWISLPTEEGPIALIAESLNRGFARQTEIQEQSQQAARQVKTDLTGSLDDARESAEHAEHGFVEATSLLTTLRELERLRAELQQSTAAAPAVVAAPGGEAWRTAAAGAIEELIAAAGGSVEHLASGLMHVQEIADQVQLVSNRATLIALNTVVAGTRPEGTAPQTEDLAQELKQLAREIRTATDRVGTLSREVESEVQAANERMRGVRERVSQKLDLAPPAPIAIPQAAPEENQRLLERVREMVQDATRKGERLSSSGERASRAAESLVRRLEDVARDMDGLVVRLTPVGSTATEALGPAREPRPEERGRLRVLDRRDDSRSGDAPGRGREERS